MKTQVFIKGQIMCSLAQTSGGNLQNVQKFTKDDELYTI
jgi:hypothetical protein